MATPLDFPGALGAPGASFLSSAVAFAANNATGGGNATVAGTYLSERFSTWYIPACAAAGLLFALYQVAFVSSVRVHSLLLDEDDTEALLGPAGEHDDIAKSAAQIHRAIKEGAVAFLRTEYRAIASFMLPFALFIFFLLGSGDMFTWKWKDDPKGVLRSPKVANGLFSALSFSLGAITSVICGYLGMMIGTYGNVRTAVEARRGMAPAFSTAYRSGSVMGFLLSSLALLMLYGAIQLYRMYFKDDWASLYAAIAGYGLGGSAVALFGRVGGGVYTKAADVGADLVGKVERNIPEDDPRNPAVVADLVGDCVGDIAGMGADLFGSFAEASVSALVLSSVSSLGDNHLWTAMCFPLHISATSILVCIFTTFLASDVSPARSIRQIQPVLKSQLIISSVLMAIVMFPVTLGALPNAFTGVYIFDDARICSHWQVYVAVLSGIVTALLIGLVTEYYTSTAYRPVRDVAEACRTGAATNIIYGLALGYKSVIIPILGIATTIFLAYEMASFYGIACAALGMLGTLSTCLTIDAYGPIADNAGGIAEMSHMGEEVRERTDALDAAGNTTAAIGKGFAIGSAALVSLALFGSFVTQAHLGMADASLLDNKVIMGLLVGAMLPYWFSALTVKAVGKAALRMVEEVRFQFRTIPGLMEGSARPNYDRCIGICTKSSLREMVAPGALVMLSPIVVGVLFGTHALAGLLAGALVSGVQMAISAANTGGAWDNAKKFIEAGATDQARSIGGKGSEAHKAAVVGDTVGDPLKDTSGPSLNILIKLMAVESLVFAPFFFQYTNKGLIFKWFR